MGFLLLAAVGLLAGWLAGLLMKGRDFGVTGNLLLGVLGSFVGGWLMLALGDVRPIALWQHTLVAVLGAMLVLGVARRVGVMVRRTRGVMRRVTSLADFEAQMRRLGDHERRALERLFNRGPIAKDANAAFEEQLTFGQRVADRVATFGGSWTFIGLFLLGMLLWMMWNTETKTRFDPFPFILLNLVLSCVAALQAPIIMMSQNRQAAKDRLMATNDFDVNVRAEMELVRLHARFDELHERDWLELVEMQRRQLELLEALVRERGPGPVG